MAYVAMVTGAAQQGGHRQRGAPHSTAVCTHTRLWRRALAAVFQRALLRVALLSGRGMRHEGDWPSTSGSMARK